MNFELMERNSGMIKMLIIQTYCCGESVTLENCKAKTEILHLEPSLKTNAKGWNITATTTITGECPKCHERHTEIIDSKTINI